MADKIKKISINAFEEAVEKEYVPTSNVEWRGLTIVVMRRLSLNAMMTFVDSVVKSCFEQDSGTYIPEVKDFAMRSCIIEHYTNISLPSNIERRYELLYRSDIFDAIMEHIDQLQFNAMIRAIEDKLSHLAQSNIDAVTKQMNELYASVEKMVERLGSEFDGIDGEQISKIVNAIADGQIDERKIVKAIISERQDMSGEA